MKHIGYAVLKDGKPTGEMRALCGARTSSVAPMATVADDVCPECRRRQERGS